MLGIAIESQHSLFGSSVFTGDCLLLNLNAEATLVGVGVYATVYIRVVDVVSAPSHLATVY